MEFVVNPIEEPIFMSNFDQGGTLCDCQITCYCFVQHQCPQDCVTVCGTYCETYGCPPWAFSAKDIK